MTDRFLIGRVDITDNLQFVYETIQSGNPNVVVINLDEDNQQLKHSRNVLGGTELLPSVDCMLAEVNGDEQLYDYLYSMHFGDPFVVQYITMLIAAIHQGKSILMYYPTLDPSETKTVPKLIDQFWKNFGIGIGIIGVCNGQYNLNMGYLWCKLLYLNNIIPVKEFLIEAPEEILNNDMEIMEKLIFDLLPYGDDINTKIEYIKNYWIHIKQNPNLKIAIHGL